jgi:DNA-binding CsgD family transcriptional regulator
MNELLYLLIFFFCLAFAAGAILLSQKLKISQQEEMFESLFYYVILIVFFGFYSIWGQLIIYRVMQFFTAEPEMLFVIGQVIPLMGYPFLVMGGYMLIRFGHELWGRRIRPGESTGFFFFYIFLFAVFGWFSFHDFQSNNFSLENPITLLILFFTIQEIVIHSWFLLIQIRHMIQRRLDYRNAAGTFVLIVFFLMVLRLAAISLILLQFNWAAPVFVFAFFLSLPTPVFYLYRHHENILHEVQPDLRITNTRDRILQRNGVTRREGEIIELICRGKTNQEIADRLFISLQTVKDHTHRIYLKLEVKNRMQLIHLLQKHGS